MSLIMDLQEAIQINSPDGIDSITQKEKMYLSAVVDGLQIALNIAREYEDSPPPDSQQETAFHWVHNEGGSWLECDCDCEAPDCLSGVCDRVKDASYRQPEQDSQQGDVCPRCSYHYAGGVQKVYSYCKECYSKRTGQEGSL